MVNGQHNSRLTADDQQQNPIAFLLNIRSKMNSQTSYKVHYDLHFQLTHIQNIARNGMLLPLLYQLMHINLCKKNTTKKFLTKKQISVGNIHIHVSVTSHKVIQVFWWVGVKTELSLAVIYKNSTLNHW